jgi:hypothetical protein
MFVSQDIPISNTLISRFYCTPQNLREVRTEPRQVVRFRAPVHAGATGTAGGRSDMCVCGWLECRGVVDMTSMGIFRKSFASGEL